LICPSYRDRDKPIRPEGNIMNLIRCIRRSAAVLAVLAGAVLAFAAPAFAWVPSPVGDSSGAQVPAQVPVQVRTIVAGGMPGWQIALIAAGAALIAAALAVLADRTLATRRGALTSAA
jgi:hypothetical protein